MVYILPFVFCFSNGVLPFKVQQNDNAQITTPQQESPYVDHAANNSSFLHGNNPLIQE